MSRYIVGPRQSGRSTRLIELAAENDGVIITATEARARCIQNQARDLGYTIQKPIGATSFVRLRGVFMDKEQQFMFDDLEAVIYSLTGARVSVAVIECGKVKEKSLWQRIRDWFAGGAA